MKILIVEDEERIRKVVRSFLVKNGYIVREAADGEEGLDLFYEWNPDLVLLDVMMPKKDGFEVCKEIRKFSNVPIIMISAKGEDYEKIMGLDIGADDYIVKPFSPGEVIARVRAILRRVIPLESNNENSSSKVFIFDNLNINLNNFTVTIDTQFVSLTKKEIELLWTIASNPKKVFTRDDLLDSIWGFDYFGDSRTVDSHIKRLRAKLDHYPHEKWNIKTIWGVGYKFESNE